MPEPNALLDALLDAAGMSQQGLASRVNRAAAARGMTTSYDHSSVHRWLRGQRPRDPAPELVAEVLSERLGRTLTYEDAGFGVRRTQPGVAQPLGRFIDKATALWRADKQGRADVDELQVVSGVGAIAPIWEWENPPHDVSVARTGDGTMVGASDVGRLADAKGHYQEMYRRAGGLATHSRLAGFLVTQATPLLYGTFDDKTGRDLYRAIGGLTSLAGNCAYDSGRHPLAQRYFHHALRLAKASGDRPFGSYVLALMVNQALALGDFRQAVGVAEAALRNPSGISAALNADLSVMQASAYAQMGDSASMYKAVARAEKALTNIAARNEPTETSYVQAGVIEIRLVEAMIYIGDLKPAGQYAPQPTDANLHPRGRVNRLATLATLALRSGDVDQAAHLAIEMIEQAQGMESDRLRARFVKLRNALSRIESRTGVDAIERIDRALHVLP